MTPNFDNLTKLARRLQYVNEDNFRMGAFHTVVDGKLFAETYPEMATEAVAVNPYRNNFDDLTGIHDLGLIDDDAAFFLPHFKIEYGCGTAGCALGWAPTLVAEALPHESWGNYSARVFGVDISSDEWDFMFSGMWENEQDTPKATAGRIMSFVNSGGEVVIDWRELVYAYDIPVVEPVFEEVK